MVDLRYGDVVPVINILIPENYSNLTLAVQFLWWFLQATAIFFSKPHRARQFPVQHVRFNLSRAMLLEFM